MTVFCGVDWAENHHDVAVVDDRGQLLVKRRIGDDAAGFRVLLELLAEHGDTAAEPIPVAIETSRGLLVACLRAAGRPVYAINPLAVSRYRGRHSVARAKSDHADAMILANIVRTDADAHRPLPADSELVQAIAVLARGGQDAAWSVGRAGVADAVVEEGGDVAAVAAVDEFDVVDAVAAQLLEVGHGALHGLDAGGDGSEQLAADFADPLEAVEVVELFEPVVQGGVGVHGSCP
jgi:Transposase